MMSLFWKLHTAELPMMVRTLKFYTLTPPWMLITVDFAEIEMEIDVEILLMLSNFRFQTPRLQHSHSELMISALN